MKNHIWIQYIQQESCVILHIAVLPQLIEHKHQQVIVEVAVAAVAVVVVPHMVEEVVLLEVAEAVVVKKC